MSKCKKIVSGILSLVIIGELINPLHAFASGEDACEDTVNINTEEAGGAEEAVTEENTYDTQVTTGEEAGGAEEAVTEEITTDDNTSEGTESSYDENADPDSDYFDIDSLVANGEFDSEHLSEEQKEYIYELYNEDPMAISELQKKSDYNSSDSVSLYASYGSGYSHNSKFSSYDVKNGIDVSQWQGEIDWEKVKASGIDFAIIRVAYRAYGSGVLYADESYQENLQGALDAGLDVGIYIFSQAVSCTEAAQEASYAINLAKNYSYTLPVVMDFEYASGNSGRLAEAKLTVSQATTICNYFCYTVEKYNKVGMLYANKSLLTDDVDAADISSKYPVWLAHYTASTSYSGDYSYWQYSSTGTVPGISGNVDMDFRYIKNPSAPGTLSYAASSTGTSITLNWSRIKDAYGYQVFRLNDSTGKYELVGSVIGPGNTEYTDNDVTPDDVFKYTVRAVYKLSAGSYYGSFSPAVIAPASQKQVKGLKGTAKSGSSINLVWTAQSGISGYRIMRYDKYTGKYVCAAVINNPSATSYTDTGLEAGLNYTYRIQAYHSAYDSIYYYTYSDAAVVCTSPGKVTGLKASGYNSSSITLTWHGQIGVNGYYIFRYNTKTGKWNCVGQTKGAGATTYKDTGLASGYTYKYCVRAYYTASNGSTAYAACSDAYNACTSTKAVSSLKVTNCATDGVTLSWGKAAGAHGYAVFIYDTGTKSYKLYKRIDDGNTLTCTVTGLTAGKKYTIMVRPWKKATGNAYYFGAASTIDVKTRPGNLSGLKSVGLKNRRVLTWTPDGFSDGYYIYYYDTVKKTFTYVNTVSGQNNNSYSAPVLSSRYNYYVCGYITVNGKNYRGTLSKASDVTKTLTGKVTANTLNVRRGASTSYGVVKQITYGQAVTITDSLVTGNKTWYKISFTSSGKTYTGYVSGQYIRVY